MITKTQIINTAKDIIANKYDGFHKNQLVDDLSLRRSFLKFDDLDIYELLMELENHYNIFVEEKDVKDFEKAKTLSDFCALFLQYVHPDLSQINTKDDVFKILNSHLQSKYYIMNARMSDNFFVDLHFHEIERSELIKWADETFGIMLPRTYFINLDDFCDKILKCLPKKEVVKQQPQNKFKLFIANILQRTK